MPKHHKSTWALGMETLLNSEASPLKNPKGFSEMMKNSEMPVSSVITHLGKTARGRRHPEKPTDEERSEMRLAQMGGQ